MTCIQFVSDNASLGLRGRGETEAVNLKWPLRPFGFEMPNMLRVVMAEGGVDRYGVE